MDALLQGNRADYIKMDVEGVERETLLGCRETIARWKPQLSVAAYHRTGDLWERRCWCESLVRITGCICAGTSMSRPGRSYCTPYKSNSRS